MSSVKKLCLNHTGIFTLSPSIGRMTNLEILSLESNNLSDLPATLEYCQNLAELNLKGNNFTFVPGVVLKLNNLKEFKHSCSTLLSQQSVQAIHPEHTADVTHMPAPLKRMSIAAVLVNHIDYWKDMSGCHDKSISEMDQLLSCTALCHNCRALVSRGK